MAEQFDEAMVERLAVVFVSGVGEGFAGRYPAWAAEGAQPTIDSIPSVEDGLRAILSALSQDYAIVPKAEAQVAILEAAVEKACDLLVTLCYEPPKHPLKARLGLSKEERRVRASRWREWLMSKESPHV